MNIAKEPGSLCPSSPKQSIIDVLIIGAGAAGMMCAIEAARRGRRVCVLDHSNKAGKKILMSGGGRCNFTNRDVGPQHFHSSNPHFCKSALSRYTPQDFITKVQAHGIPFHEKTLGQLFCDQKSKAIQAMLLKELHEAGADLKLNTAVQHVARSADGFFRVATASCAYQAESLVVATGGLSIPTLGASPFGYRLAEQFGLKLKPTRAGLVPVTWKPEDKARYEVLSGVALPCEVRAKGPAFKEGMLFTHRGLSGPSVLQASSYWHEGEPLYVSMLPDVDVRTRLQQARQQAPKQSVKSFLQRFLPKSVLAVFVPEGWLQRSLGSLSDADCCGLAASFQAWCVQPNGTEGYRTAEVTLGGVDVDALSSKTMMVRHVPGLYFIGEVLDVTGWLGGYNFQWAWASAFAAGQVV